MTRCSLPVTTNLVTAVLICGLAALLLLSLIGRRAAANSVMTSAPAVMTSSPAAVVSTPITAVVSTPAPNNKTSLAFVPKHSSFLEDDQARGSYLRELPFALSYHNVSLLNISVKAFLERQSQQCFDQRLNATTGGAISRSFYRRGSAYFPSPNATESDEVMQVLSRGAAYEPVRSACLLTGMLRTYQEVFDIMSSVLFLPTNCDIFVSTQALRGFAQLRFGFPSGSAPYDGIAAEIEQEVMATLESVKHRLKFLHIHPFSVAQGNSFINDSAKDGRHFAIPLYMHMEAAYQGMLQEEKRSGAYEVVLHLRPDLWFQYNSPLHIVRGDDDRLRLVRDGVVILLANDTVIVNGRFTAPWRVNDHLTFGLRLPMGRWMRSYYFVKYVAPVNSVHSEGGKRIVLNHLRLFTCSMDLRVQAMKQGAEIRKNKLLAATNSRWCFRNCSFVHPLYCSKFHNVPLMRPPCGTV